MKKISALICWIWRGYPIFGQNCHAEHVRTPFSWSKSFRTRFTDSVGRRHLKKCLIHQLTYLVTMILHFQNSMSCILNCPFASHVFHGFWWLLIFVFFTRFLSSARAHPDPYSWDDLADPLGWSHLNLGWWGVVVLALGIRNRNAIRYCNCPIGGMTLFQYGYIYILYIYIHIYIYVYYIYNYIYT